MRVHGGLAAAAVAVTCILQASDAPACGVAYPTGSFARFSDERSLIVWDAAKKTEHFIRALSLKGDPETFGVFVPTPTLPAIAKENDAIIDRVAQLFTPPTPPQAMAGGGGKGPMATGSPPVQVLQRTQIGDFEAVTLKAADEKSLGDWLAKNKFVDKPALRTWEKTYLDKKWLITAVRCTAKGTGDRQLEVPTMRLSFSIDAPFFPYTEVPADPADEAAYQKKYNTSPTAYRGYNYGTRPFDVYVVAQSQMQGLMGNVTGGPPVSDAIRVSSDAVAGALGDTKAWGFDAKSQPRWVVTHLSENAWMRNASSDLTFASYDLPKPRPGPGESAMDDRPNGPVYPASSMMWMADPSGAHGGKKHSNTRARIGVIALFFLIAGAAGYAVLSEQDKKRKAKS
jgi:hypothetical protein